MNEVSLFFFFFFQAEDGIRDLTVTGVQTCALPIFQGKPLPVEHGGPVSIVPPQLYAWKGAKWIHRIELLTRDRLGYSEVRGHSHPAHPWRKAPYSYLCCSHPPPNPPRRSTYSTTYT